MISERGPNLASLRAAIGDLGHGDRTVRQQATDLLSVYGSLVVGDLLEATHSDNPLSRANSILSAASCGRHSLPVSERANCDVSSALFSKDFYFYET